MHRGGASQMPLASEQIADLGQPEERGSPHRIDERVELAARRRTRALDEVSGAFFGTPGANDLRARDEHFFLGALEIALLIEQRERALREVAGIRAAVARAYQRERVAG